MPSRDARLELYAKSGGYCEFLLCYKHCHEEGTPAGDPPQNTGEIHHIRSASKGGKRYDATYPEHLLDQVGNLMLLCSDHHDIITKQDKAYTVQLQTTWKLHHEARVHRGGAKRIEDLALDLGQLKGRSKGRCAYPRCTTRAWTRDPLPERGTLAWTVLPIELPRSSKKPTCLRYSNLIVLCREHRQEVAQRRGDHPIALLVSWKAALEAAVRESDEYDRNDNYDRD